MIEHILLKLGYLQFYEEIVKESVFSLDSFLYRKENTTGTQIIFKASCAMNFAGHNIVPSLSHVMIFSCSLANYRVLNDWSILKRI